MVVSLIALRWIGHINIGSSRYKLFTSTALGHVDIIYFFKPHLELETSNSVDHG